MRGGILIGGGRSSPREGERGHGERERSVGKREKRDWGREAEKESGEIGRAAREQELQAPAVNSGHGGVARVRERGSVAGNFESGGEPGSRDKERKRKGNRAGSRVTSPDPFKTQRFAKNAFKTTSFR